MIRRDQDADHRLIRFPAEGPLLEPFPNRHASTSGRCPAGASEEPKLTSVCCKHRLFGVDNTHPTEASMSYDRERAREHFQAKTEFTTGTHEVLGMIDQE